MIRNNWTTANGVIKDFGFTQTMLIRVANEILEESSETVKNKLSNSTYSQLFRNSFFAVSKIRVYYKLLADAINEVGRGNVKFDAEKTIANLPLSHEERSGALKVLAHLNKKRKDPISPTDLMSELQLEKLRTYLSHIEDEHNQNTLFLENGK